MHAPADVAVVRLALQRHRACSRLCMLCPDARPGQSNFSAGSVKETRVLPDTGCGPLGLRRGSLEEAREERT